MAGNRKLDGAEDVVWNGVIYRRYPLNGQLHRSRYFMATTAPREYLHRAIYKAAAGPIPAGWHVHHVDGNYNNNELSNLVAVAPDTHVHLHVNDRAPISSVCHGCGTAFAATFRRAKWCCAACKERYRRSIGKAYVRPAAPAPELHIACAQCSTPVTSIKPWARFCGQSCRNTFNNERRRTA